MGLKQSQAVTNAVIYIILTIISIIWLIPILWVVLTSFRLEGGSFTANFIPEHFTLNNYINLWTNSVFPFRYWFVNTLWVAIVSCIISTFFTLSVAYVLSRLRFSFRKFYMNFALILGMFPGFMSMIAVYFILKAIGLTQNLWALVVQYSAGAGINFFISKGFFDTIPKSLDEAAKLDGATNAQVFRYIIMPNSGPIVVYTALMSFMAPWNDFIFANVIMGDNYNKWTSAIGLYQMIQPNNIYNNFTQFNAGCVCIAIPIMILFFALQKYYVAGVTGGAVKG
ncbi:MAG: ABC transmembrane type-1 domain-containing protein [Clostridium sp.]|jgi:arabinogalactan oligomer / maltooligosaccharide transport system permease protein